MDNTFKIYVTTLDEEVLIGHTLDALFKVFEPKQIEVIDIGSKDATLDLIPETVKVHKEVLPEKDAGMFFTDLKNRYSRRQEWVLWVDGDEIYPTSSLLRIKDWVNRGQQGYHAEKAVRLYWKVLKEEGGDIFCSNEYLSAGPKLFNSKYQHFKRAWPDEVTVHATNGYPAKHKSEFTGIWFWHGVLLNRSSAPERTARRKKRHAKVNRYNSHMTWTALPVVPWEFSYEGSTDPNWTVVHMNIHDNAEPATKWKGVLDGA